MTRRDARRGRTARRPPQTRRRPVRRASFAETRPEIDWEKLCREMKPDIDFPAILELQATLGRLPPS